MLKDHGGYLVSPWDKGNGLFCFPLGESGLLVIMWANSIEEKPNSVVHILSLARGIAILWALQLVYLLSVFLQKKKWTAVLSKWIISVVLRQLTFAFFIMARFQYSYYWYNMSCCMNIKNTIIFSTNISNFCFTSTLGVCFLKKWHLRGGQIAQ